MVLRRLRERSPRISEKPRRFISLTLFIYLPH
jgi:hypothetical protein